MKRVKLYSLLLLAPILFNCANKEILKPLPEDKPLYEKIFVGILNKNSPLSLKYPSELCLDDGFLYQGVPYRIENYNLYSKPEIELKAFEGKVVIIKGSFKKDVNRIMTKMKACPEGYGREKSSLQIRSDWVSNETGFAIGRSSKKRLSQLQYFEYMRVKEFNGLEIIKEDKIKKVRVSFKNIFDRDLKDISIIAHYEIMRGKPVPVFKTKKFILIKRGSKATCTFPSVFKVQDKHASKTWESNGSLQSVYIQGETGDITIKIEKFLGSGEN